MEDRFTNNESYLVGFIEKDILLIPAMLCKISCFGQWFLASRKVGEKRVACNCVYLKIICLFKIVNRRLRVFENRVLRRIFGSKREWRRLHKEELYILYSSPDIIRMIKSRKLRWAGHVARMREQAHTGFQWESLSEGDHSEDPGVDGRIILKFIFEKWDGGGMDLISLTEDRDRWRAVVKAVMNFWFR